MLTLRPHYIAGGLLDKITTELRQLDSEAPMSESSSLTRTSQVVILSCRGSAFDADDTFGLLVFEKFIAIVMFRQTSLIYTSYFLTSRSGQL